MVKKKRYRVRKGSMAYYIKKNWMPVVVLSSVSLVIGGMAVMQNAFAKTEPPEPAEPVAVVKEVILYEEEIEEIEEPELISLGEYRITYYCSCGRCCGVWAENRPNGIVYTASGAKAEAGKTIAVDPDVIPYGTEVVIEGHTYIAQDSGSAIKGNRIDIYCDSHDEAIEGGVKYAEVFLKGSEE